VTWRIYAYTEHVQSIQTGETRECETVENYEVTLVNGDCFAIAEIDAYAACEYAVSLCGSSVKSVYPVSLAENVPSTAVYPFPAERDSQ
jgi:hypothetical protein